jgi:hypothetical protein
MVKVLLILIVVAILMEDGLSVKKKSEEERKEDEKIAEAVNATLAAEEEEKRKEEEEKKKGRTGNGARKKKEDEASSSPNCTCPIVDPCPEVKKCPEVEHCSPKENCTEPEQCDPCQECPPVKECGPCPEVRPCKPCPVANGTGTTPLVCQCPEGMSLSTAVAVGTVAGFLVTGMATVIGLVIRYVPPIVSGFLFLSTIIIVWYLSSQHPEMARDLGGRAMATLREATIALGHRVMEAIQRHQDQVGLSALILISS